MLAAFIGHGSPMNALEANRYTESWTALGAALPRPRAILVVSAHWYVNATAVTAMGRPRAAGTRSYLRAQSGRPSAPSVSRSVIASEVSTPRPCSE